jgi:hypothetical protein
MKSNVWLRLEGAAELAVACLFYARSGGNWYLFAALFLTPDIGMLGYLKSPAAGAWTYNLLHTYCFALPLAVAGILLGHPVMTSIGVIWCAHIAFDRMAGYGLKSADSFKSTHLGRLDN